MRRLGFLYRNWLAFALVATLLAVSIVLVLREHHLEEEQYAQQQFQAHLNWMTQFSEIQLEAADYEQLDQMLTAWAGNNRQILQLTITAKNGFAIVDYRGPPQPGEQLRAAQVIPYGIESQATLTLAMEHESHKHVLRALAWRVGLLYLSLLALAGVLLQQRLTRQQEAQTLRARTGELEAARNRLADLEAQQRLLLECVGEGIYGFDLDGRCTFANAQALRMLGFTNAGELIGQATHPLFHHHHADGTAYPESECRTLVSIRTGESAFIDDEIFWRADGSAFPVEYHTVPMRHGDAIVGGVVTFADISARLASEARLRTLSHAVEQSPVSIMVTDRSGRLEYVNPAFERISGYPRDEVIGRNPRFLKSGKTPRSAYETLWATITAGQFWSGEFCCRRKDGRLYWERAHISPVIDARGVITHFLGMKEDITREREQAETIRYQAEFDALTGIPNRHLTLERLSQAVARSRRSGVPTALMFVDLDDFKKVNDTLGHDAGDALLVEAAQRFQSVIREGDTVGRHGGDEFLIVIENGGDAAAAARIARELLKQLSLPFTIADVSVQVTPSIGIAVFPENGEDAAELLKNADAAMYAAKANGRNGFSFFTAELNQAANRRLELERHLATALANGELSLEYQPQMDTEARTVIGVEALIRWRNPILGAVPPDQFIPLAEQTGQIIPIGRWVLDQAARQIKEWHLAGYRDLRVAVNVSPRQFRTGEDGQNVLSLVQDVLQRHQLPPTALELEITEGLLVRQQSDTKALLEALSTLGVRISMDDFGTGYSSLAYLRHFPFDIVKIDRSFIQDLETDAEDRELVAAILSMARSLSVTTVAEGVETAAQLEFLQAHGCHVIQGYFFGRPMPPLLLTRFLADQAQQRAADTDPIGSSNFQI